MDLKLRGNSKLARALGPSWLTLLHESFTALSRILPHTESSNWQISDGPVKTRATFSGPARKALSLVVNVSVGSHHWGIKGQLTRRSIPDGVGAISRTIDVRERHIAECIVLEIGEMFGAVRTNDISAAHALRQGFDERVVARHLTSHHKLDINLGDWFVALRQLAEQSYENKALTFGCIVHTSDRRSPSKGLRFPGDFLERKRYKALSDGYRTVYRVSSKGAIVGFTDLPAATSTPGGLKYHPQWCNEVASQSDGDRLGFCLTRQGDLLVLDSGRLTLTYRFGRWQYWNHSHIVDLIKNAARVQRVPPARVSSVVRSIYRAALDVAFRRSGALFLVLRSKNDLRRVVRPGDAIGDKRRPKQDKAFDEVLDEFFVQSAPRSVVSELAALDGAVVLANSGRVLAYGAVLDPRRKGRVRAAEGSRTKAAIGASNYGLAVKISSDGDITVYVKGRKLIVV